MQFSCGRDRFPRRGDVHGEVPGKILNASGDESRPACLMRGPQAPPGISVEELVEKDEVLPMWISVIETAASSGKALAPEASGRNNLVRRREISRPPR